MSDINEVILIGRLTADVELRYSQSGTAMATIGLAVNRSQKQSDGSWADVASFFSVQLFGKTAENVQKYSGKGRQLAVQGYLQQQRWEKDGKQNSRVVVVANSVQFVSNKDETKSPNPNKVDTYEGKPYAENQSGFQEDIPYDTGDMDIPF